MMYGTLESISFKVLATILYVFLNMIAEVSEYVMSGFSLNKELSGKCAEIDSYFIHYVRFGILGFIMGFFVGICVFIFCVG